MTADEAVTLIRSHTRVFVHGGAATPSVLLEALVRRADELEQVETVHLHLEGDAPHVRPEFAKSFRANAFFCGANLRQAVAEGRADYMPVFLSEIPLLFRNGVLPLDAALLHVSLPDEHGYVSLGTSVDTALAAAESAKTVIAQVNPRMPRTLGDSSRAREPVRGPGAGGRTAAGARSGRDGPGGARHRPGDRRPGGGRRHAADGHRRDPGRGAALAHGAPGARGTHGDVQRRADAADRERRGHQRAQAAAAGQDGRELRDRHAPGVRLRRRQPGGGDARLQLRQRHRRSSGSNRR